MANEYRTLPIGTEFTYDGNKYKVCKYKPSHNTSCCDFCAFQNYKCVNSNLKQIRGECYRFNRVDKTEVYFKQINNETMNKNNNDNDNDTNTKFINAVFNLDNSLSDIKITCPKGYVIDVEHSDLSKGIIKFKKDNITLEDVYKNHGKNTFITNVVSNNTHTYNKIFAIATLLDIANYYNKDWKPDWNNDEKKYIIKYTYIINKYSVDIRYNINYGSIVFKHKEDAQAVIDNPNFRGILDRIYKD